MPLGLRGRQDWEEAAAHTKSTRSLDDLLKTSRKKTTAPAGSYSELKLNIGTYCGLLWSLFRQNCDYYKELLKIYRVLDRQECFSICEAYTKEVCARTYHVGHFGRRTVLLWTNCGGSGLCPGGTRPPRNLIPRGYYRLCSQCELGPTGNLSSGVDDSRDPGKHLPGTAGGGAPNKLGYSPSGRPGGRTTH
jgi:hypothetical protein